jgi:hypothetical protein
VRKFLSALVSTLALTSIVGAGFVPAANANPTAGYAAETGPAETVGIAGAPTLGQWVSQRVSGSGAFFSAGISPSWIPSTGISREAWKSALADTAVRVGANGRAFVLEPKFTRAEIAAAQTASAAPHSTVPTSDAFLLHSKPGSDKVIYLDFTGYVLSDSWWNLSSDVGGADVPNGTVFAPFDYDGNTGTFNSAERQAMIDAWSLVAEDYAAFDVDVTTEDPGADAIYRNGFYDVNYGARAVISGFNNPIANSCECGGVAYVGVFDLDRDEYSGITDLTPAWAWAEAGMSGKIIADIVSHEVGHNLGLSHDGLATQYNGEPTGNDYYYMGAGSWAPIMGAGYNRPITHWARFYRGNGSGGNNLYSSNTEDDYLVMQYYGLDLRADDSGDSRATATSIPVATPRTGVIEDPADIDYYSFIATGAAHTVTVTSPALTPNLDVLLTVVSSTGTEIARSNPAIAWPGGNTVNGMGATVTINTTVGSRYFVGIEGTASNPPGIADHVDYGSIGEYILDITTATATFTTTPTPTISGTARVGAVLTAVPGSWSPSASFTYAWKRGATVVGTSNAYTPTSADRGSALTVTVTGSASGYTSVSKVSAATALVGYGIFASSPVPTVSGTARVGAVLTAVPGSWSPSATFTYAWKRGTTVVGTSNAYTPTAADRGFALTVTVTGSASGYTSVSKVSAATASVGYGVFASSPVPTVSGTARVGSVLTAVAGSWSPSATFTYAWKRGTTVVGTSSTYTPTSADRGSALTLTVTGSATGYTSAATVSVATAPVAYGVITPTPTPTITGIATVGSTLRASTGIWPTGVSLSYRWDRCSAITSLCSPILRATKSDYRVNTNDLGFTIRVSVTGTRTGYTSVTVTSAFTALAAR